MQTLQSLSLKQLNKIIRVRERIQALERKMEKLLNGHAPVPGRKPGRRGGRRRMSAAVRAKMAKAAKARWKKAKAAGKNTL